MSETRRCPNCGTPIPSEAPAGLCPKCLILEGLGSRPAADPGCSPTAPSPQEGTTSFVPPDVGELAGLLPQLEILELLGKGGMGAVYKARQRELDRLVAVKILPPEIGSDPAFAERFTREARSLARLSHGHIVSVFDFGRTQVAPPPGESAAHGPSVPVKPPAGGTAGGLFFIVMEYVEGVNLRQALQSHSLSPHDALAIVPQICEALQYAHDEGVVHRDIKPENILLDKKGRVKIADFGLAKLLGHDGPDPVLTGTNQVMGTIRYMAPEQMEGARSVDHRADIYSLGVVFYEMLTGELPLGRFAPPSHKVQLDVRLDEVVLRALEKEPARRYQQAGDVRTDIETISSTSRTRETRRPPRVIGLAESVYDRDPPVPASRVGAFFSRSTGWIILFAVLGALSAALPWKKVEFRADEKVVVTIVSGYEIWPGLAVSAGCALLGILLVVDGVTIRHPALWRPLLTLFTAAALLTILSVDMAAAWPPSGYATEYPVLPHESIDAARQSADSFALRIARGVQHRAIVTPRFGSYLALGAGVCLLLVGGRQLAVRNRGRRDSRLSP